MAELATSNILVGGSGILGLLVPMLLVGLLVGMGYALGTSRRRTVSGGKGNDDD